MDADWHAVRVTDPSPTDLEIGRAAELLPIETVAASAGIAAEHLESYGGYIAKVAPTALPAVSDRPPRSTSSSRR